MFRKQLYDCTHGVVPAMRDLIWFTVQLIYDLCTHRIVRPFVTRGTAGEIAVIRRTIISFRGVSFDNLAIKGNWIPVCCSTSIDNHEW